MTNDDDVFRDLVKRIGALEAEEEEEDINLYDITNTVSSMSELSALLTQYICRNIDAKVDGGELVFPAEAVSKVLELFEASGKVIEIMEDFFYAIDDNADDEEEDGDED